MTRRPRMVSGAAAPGRIGVPLVPTVLLADADADARDMMRDALLEGTGPCDLRASPPSPRSRSTWRPTTSRRRRRR